MNEQTNETVKPKRYRRVRVTKPEVVKTEPVMSDYEMDRIVREWERKHAKPLHERIWDGIVTVLGFIVYAISLIFGIIIGIGGCILNFAFYIICFLIGWWVLVGLWNWIF